MCNQFTLPKTNTIQKYLTENLNLPLIKPSFTSEENSIFPGQVASVLLYQDQKLQLVNKKWGFLSPVDQKLVFNARIERFYEEKPSMWDQAFAKKRCLIICRNFFEYGKNYYQGQNGKKYREQYQFNNPNEDLTMIAGIYQDDRFSMVTTTPNQVMQPIHQRMPLVIEPSELRRWLFQNFTQLIDRQNIQLQVNKLAHKN